MPIYLTRYARIPRSDVLTHQAARPMLPWFVAKFQRTRSHFYRSRPGRPSCLASVYAEVALQGRRLAQVFTSRPRLNVGSRCICVIRSSGSRFAQPCPAPCPSGISGSSLPAPIDTNSIAGNDHSTLGTAHFHSHFALKPRIGAVHPYPTTNRIPGITCPDSVRRSRARGA
jgi:hypothetical protein